MSDPQFREEHDILLFPEQQRSKLVQTLLRLLEPGKKDSGSLVSGAFLVATVRRTP